MKEKIRILLIFLFGFTLCNNVVYIFRFNDTYLNIGFLITILLFLFEVIVEKKNPLYYMRKINIYFKIFILFCIISAIPMFLFVSEEISKTSYISGLIYLFLGIMIYLDVIMCCKDKKLIYKGICYGVLINVVFSLIQYVTYKAGNCFSLFVWFPQNAFQVSNINLRSALTMYISSYRAQGVFLETSYYMAFIACTIPIFLEKTEKASSKFIIMAISLFCALNSSSGIIALIFVSLILYWGSRNFKSQKIKRTTIVQILIILVLMAIGMLITILLQEDIIGMENIIEKVNYSLQSSNILDEDNHERATAMNNAIKAIKKYPFGVGYNMMTKIMKYEFIGQMKVYSTYNYLFTLILENGIIGAIPFVAFILNISLKNILNKTKEKRFIGVSALVLFVSQIFCGFHFILMPFIMLIYAMADIEREECHG